MTGDAVALDVNNVCMCYDIWRREQKLPDIKNPLLITTALADKLGRICRNVKHLERNDPRPLWLAELEDEMAGILVYMILLAKHYNLSISCGVSRELSKGVAQHGENNVVVGTSQEIPPGDV